MKDNPAGLTGASLELMACGCALELVLIVGFVLLFVPTMHYWIDAFTSEESHEAP